MSLPALLFLYPLTITLILLCLFGRWFDYDRRVFVCVTAFTFVPAVFDFIGALPAAAIDALGGETLLAIGRCLPLSSIGMSWIVPSIAGLILGLALHVRAARKGA